MSKPTCGVCGSEVDITAPSSHKPEGVGADTDSHSESCKCFSCQELFIRSNTVVATIYVPYDEGNGYWDEYNQDIYLYQLEPRFQSAILHADSLAKALEKLIPRCDVCGTMTDKYVDDNGPYCSLKCWNEANGEEETDEEILEIHKPVTIAIETLAAYRNGLKI